MAKAGDRKVIRLSEIYQQSSLRWLCKLESKWKRADSKNTSGTNCSTTDCCSPILGYLLPYCVPIQHYEDLTLLVHVGLFCCSHNPSNSDMDYRFYNVLMWYICMRIHTGDFGLQSHPKKLKRRVCVILKTTTFFSLCAGPGEMGGGGGGERDLWLHESYKIHQMGSLTCQRKTPNCSILIASARKKSAKIYFTRSYRVNIPQSLGIWIRGWHVCGWR